MQYTPTYMSTYTEMCQGTQNYSYSPRNKSTYNINESTYNINESTYNIRRYTVTPYADIRLYMLYMCTVTAHTEIQSQHTQKYTIISEHMQKNM